jgi:hypothetical protein
MVFFRRHIGDEQELPVANRHIQQQNPAVHVGEKNQSLFVERTVTGAIPVDAHGDIESRRLHAKPIEVLIAAIANCDGRVIRVVHGHDDLGSNIAPFGSL